MKNSEIHKLFKNEIEPKMHEYDIIYKNFEKGDFGSLIQIEFNSNKIGGNIDLWSKGWLGIFIWDFINEKEIMNTLNEPEKLEMKKENFNKLKKIILK